MRVLLKGAIKLVYARLLGREGMERVAEYAQKFGGAF